MSFELLLHAAPCVFLLSDPHITVTSLPLGKMCKTEAASGETCNSLFSGTDVLTRPQRGGDWPLCAGCFVSYSKNLIAFKLKYASGLMQDELIDLDIFGPFHSQLPLHHFSALHDVTKGTPPRSPAECPCLFCVVLNPCQIPGRFITVPSVPSNSDSFYITLVCH